MTGVALHLLRHGAPERPGLLLGRTDDAPTAEGLAVCADRASGLSFDRVIASDLQRCRLAGEDIGAARDLPLTVDARWRELDFGAWDGKAPGAIDPHALGRFRADPDACPPLDGERWSALVARVAGAIDALEPVPTLVVTHGGAMRAALHHLCGFDQRAVWAFDLPYGAVLSLRLWRSEQTAQITGLRA